MNVAAASWALEEIHQAFPAAFAQFARAVSPAAAQAVLDALWQGAAVALVLFFLLRLAPRVSAAHRFAAWSAGFALVAALPFLPHFFPAANVAAQVSAVSSSPRPFLEVSSGWAFAIAVLWLFASLLRLADLVSHSARLHRLWKTATPVANDPQDLASMWSGPHLKGHASAGCGNTLTKGLCNKGTALAGPTKAEKITGALAPEGCSFEICTTTQLDRPSVIGFFAPRILIPEWLYARLSPQELRQVVLHEMEHLRRHDDWTNLIQKFVLVLFPLNPALAWIERRLCREREMACDEGVVRETHAPRAYAACLASLAQRGLERHLTGRAEALSLAAWRRRPELVRRVHGILWRKPALGPAASAVLLGIIGCGLLAGSVELARCPQLVGFAAVPQPHGPAQANAAKIDRVLPSAPSGAAALAKSEAGFHMVQANSVLPASRNQGVISAPAQTRRATQFTPAESQIASREAIGGAPHETLLRAQMPSASADPAATQNSAAPQYIVLTALQVETVPQNSREIADYDTGAASDQDPGVPQPAANENSKPVVAAPAQIVVTRLIFRIDPENKAAASQAGENKAEASGPNHDGSPVTVHPNSKPLQQRAVIPFGSGWLIFQL